MVYLPQCLRCEDRGARWKVTSVVTVWIPFLSGSFRNYIAIHTGECVLVKTGGSKNWERAPHLFLDHSETTEALCAQILPKILCDSLYSPLKRPVVTLCFTVTDCKYTSLQRAVTKNKKLHVIRCSIRAFRWVYDRVSSVVLLTKLLWQWLETHDVWSLRIALPKTVV